MSRNYGDRHVDLTFLSPSQGFIIQGDTADDVTGHSVSVAGDINGDGFDDLIVGASNAGDGHDLAGAAYAVFGSGSGFGAIDSNTGRQVLDLTHLSSAQGFVILADAQGDQAGISVSSAGDLNGDGFDEVIVGAPFGDDGGNGDGEAYVIFGSAGGFGVADPITGRQVIDLTNLSPAQGFIVQGDTSGDKAGYSVAAAGDFNGDGFDDVIVGAPSGVDGSAGKIYVVFGSDAGFGATDPVTGRQVIDLTTLSAKQGLVILGDAPRDWAGESVSAAGDINCDGFDDIIVGASPGDDGGNGAGEGYVVFGAAYGADGTPIARSGSADAEMLIGGLGDDSLSGGGGADVIRSGAGDDIIAIGDDTFFRVDGGSGQDTLVANSFTLDLSAIANNAISGFETVDLSGGGANALLMTVDDVLDFSDLPNAALAASGFLGALSHNSLVIIGETGDQLTLLAPGAGDVGSGGAWAMAGSAAIDGTPYDVVNFTLSGTVIASVAVRDDMTLFI